MIHCFFSGGRDSALACYIAKRAADARGWRYRLVHINTTAGIRKVEEYVEEYAKWLGAELVVIRPKKTFKEYAEKIGMWPSLYPPRYRWCYYKLKLEPLTKYLHENYGEGDVIAIGVRGDESKFRALYYTSTFFRRKYGKVEALVWAPLLHVDDAMVERLLRLFDIPRSPVWRFGFSGECLCLAGMPEWEIGLILRNFPEEAELLLEVDEAINRNRKGGKPSAPFRLAQRGYKTLTEYYKTVKLQATLDSFIMPYGGCQGSCML